MIMKTDCEADEALHSTNSDLLLADADGVAVSLGPGEEVDCLGDVVNVLVLARQVVAGGPGVYSVTYCALPSVT